LTPARTSSRITTKGSLANEQKGDGKENLAFFYDSTIIKEGKQRCSVYSLVTTF